MSLSRHTNKRKLPQYYGKGAAVNISTFSIQLAQSLVEQGVEEQTAAAYVKTLLRTLTEEDLREISGYRTREDFASLSLSMAKLIQEQSTPLPSAGMKERAGGAAPVRPTDVTTRHPLGKEDLHHTKTGMQPVRPGSVAKVQKHSADMEHTKIGAPVPRSGEQLPYDEEAGDRGLVSLTPRGKVRFWSLLILTLPLSLSFCTLLLLVFAFCFLTVCALIAASILLIGGEAVAGTACFLVGVIYGIIQICTASVGIGIYEIGLGIICAGVFLALGVLTYHLAVRGLPYLLRQEVLFARYFLRQGKPAINRWREGCNRE